MIGFFLSVCLEKTLEENKFWNLNIYRLFILLLGLRYLAVLYHLNQDIKDARNGEKNRSL